MAKKHDENKDLKAVYRIARIYYAQKVITVFNDAIIGIHMLGKLDFLSHYCGWTITRNGGRIDTSFKNNDNDLPRRRKKEVDHMNKSKKK